MWEKDYWNNTTLKALGLIYQLGHQGGPCKTPNGVVRSMVVVDTTGIHQIRYRRCGCDRRDRMNPRQEYMRNAWFPASATDPDSCATLRVLEVFRLLTVIGNINAHNFITALERMTSAVASTGMIKVPVSRILFLGGSSVSHDLKDRYKVFLRMTRQYAWLQIVKRAGLQHNPKGLEATKPGEATVNCWGCPFDGRNLASNWREVDPKFR